MDERCALSLNTWLVYAGHDSFMCVTWLICVAWRIRFDVWYPWPLTTWFYAGRASFTVMTWLMYLDESCPWPLKTGFYAGHDSFIHYSTRDMTRSYVWHGSFRTRTWLNMDRRQGACIHEMSHVLGLWIHDCIQDMTHSYLWHDFFIFVTWVVPLNESCPWPLKTRFYVGHDSFICLTWLVPLNETRECLIYVTWLIPLNEKNMCSWPPKTMFFSFKGMSHVTYIRHSLV